MFTSVLAVWGPALPPGRTWGYKWEIALPRSVVTGWTGPPSDDTRIKPVRFPSTKTIVSSSPHHPPRWFGASASVRGLRRQSPGPSSASSPRRTRPTVHARRRDCSRPLGSWNGCGGELGKDQDVQSRLRFVLAPGKGEQGTVGRQRECRVGRRKGRLNSQLDAHLDWRRCGRIPPQCPQPERQSPLPAVATAATAIAGKRRRRLAMLGGI